MNCPCGSGKPLAQCCQPYIDGDAGAPTAEALMRSRYTAFSLKKMDYVRDTTDPQAMSETDWAAQDAWAEQAKFTKLEVLSAKEEGNKATVEFKATFTAEGQEHVHHERSKFRKHGGVWYFREGTEVRPPAKNQ